MLTIVFLRRVSILEVSFFVVSFSFLLFFLLLSFFLSSLASPSLSPFILPSTFPLLLLLLLLFLFVLDIFTYFSYASFSLYLHHLFCIIVKSHLNPFFSSLSSFNTNFQPILVRTMTLVMTTS